MANLRPSRLSPARLRQLRLALPLGLATGLALVSASVRAQEKAAPRTSSLSWIRLAGADACVSTQELARDVEKRLGRAVFVSPAQADVSVEGHIEADSPAAGFRATITLRDATGALRGTRELKRKDVSCTEMREPLALIIAVMIDPDAALRDKGKQVEEPAPLVDVTPHVTGKDATPRAQEPASPPPPTAAPPWHFDGGASLAGSVGLLPNVGVGLSAGGLLEPPGFVPLQGFGAAWFDNDAPADGGSGVGTFSLLSAGVGICPLRARGERLFAYACVNGHGGLLTSRGAGFDQVRPDERKVTVSGAVEGRVHLRVAGPLAVRAGVSALVPFWRDTFVFRRADGTTAPLFRPAAIAGIADVGLGVIFP